jgi:hypothetical protein
VAVQPSLQNVAVLGLIVLIRTFPSFSLEVEIDGRWPWRRAFSAKARHRRIPSGEQDQTPTIEHAAAMSFVIARSATRPSAFQEGDERTDRYDTPAMSSLVWALLEALAHTGALIDPSGVLAGHRFHRIQDEEHRHGRR